ncbi:hypothetical protein IGI04_018680 [Brassica rapa subsp. trilocularis]|uniref:Uncharacterized protein n=1 Tax=Brassica rapa subsp. trilocularis TaxID=1813537 RepID=A0ABQ7MG32_BRACM|nr:hypothetical protein IGI04_018680 [Brassica rapa subsp. trilocularis]
MPWRISEFQEKESVLIDMEVVHIHVPWRLRFQKRGDHYKRAMESYRCDPEGEDVHDCSMQKTIMLKDDMYDHWKVRMKLLVRGINDAAWIAVKTGWEEPTIFSVEGKMSKPKEPR